MRQNLGLEYQLVYLLLIFGAQYSVKKRVNYLTILTEIFVALSSLAVFAWGGRFLYLYLKNIRNVERIRRIEANIAVLRMLLKSKIKKQINSIESQFQGDQVFLSLVRPQFELACKIDFTYQGDYQRLIGTLTNAFILIDTEMKKRAPSLFKDEVDNGANATEADQQLRLFPKYASSLMNLIKDIVTTTADLRSEIETYQESGNFKNNFKAPELVVINNYETLCEKSNQQQTIIELEKLKAS